MTVWTAQQIMTIWTRNGGLIANMSIAAAIALAESGGNDKAESPSDDWGLWQINGVHVGQLGTDRADWLDPDVNARMAVLISHNGADWGPWCTAWAPGQDRCGNYLGPMPQTGSPAWKSLQTIAANTQAQVDQAQAADEGPNQHQLRAQWDLLTYTYTNNAVTNSNYQHGAAAALQRLIQSVQIPR